MRDKERRPECLDPESSIVCGHTGAMVNGYAGTFAAYPIGTKEAGTPLVSTRQSAQGCAYP